jgi:hypothetical protein
LEIVRRFAALVVVTVIAWTIVCNVVRAQSPNHQHDFDFEFGSWTAQLRILRRPLSGSHDWVTYTGTSVVRKVWDGRANLGELEVGNTTTHLEALTLRIYDAQSKMWSIYFANAKVGSLETVPMVGNFNGNRGVFYDTEPFEGKTIRVRFIFSNVTPRSFELVQSFSSNNAKTWEDNWIANFTR